MNEVIFATSMTHYLSDFTERIKDDPAHTGYLCLPPKRTQQAKSSLTRTATRVDDYKSRRQEFSKIVRALTRLTLSCVHVETGDIDPLKADGPPNRPMQMLFLKQGVVQIVLQMLKTITDAVKHDSPNETTGSVDCKKLCLDEQYHRCHDIVTLSWRFIKQARTVRSLPSSSSAALEQLLCVGTNPAMRRSLQLCSNTFALLCVVVVRPARVSLPPESASSTLGWSS